MGSKDNIKNTITAKFEDKLWEDQELEDKMKLRYYKEVINPTLDNQNYFFMLTITKKKMNIARIRTNSHKLRSETRWWYIPKTPWSDRICQICNTNKVEYEKHFLLECPSLSHICSQFPNICHTSNIFDLLIQPIYSDIGALLSLLFDNRNIFLYI